jgi:hypothetical protein
MSQSQAQNSEHNGHCDPGGRTVLAACSVPAVALRLKNGQWDGSCGLGNRCALTSHRRGRAASIAIRCMTERPSGRVLSVVGLVLIRKAHFVRRMSVAAVRHMNDGREPIWLSNFSRGFEIFTFGVKIEHLARIVGSHRFNSYGRVPGHGTRLFVLVIEKEPEAWRHIGFKDGDFNKAVTEVHEEPVVRSAFNLSTAIHVPARATRTAVVCAANMPDHVVNTESLNDMVKGER